MPFEHRLQIGRLQLAQRRLSTHDGEVRRLTKRECELLMRRPGAVVSRGALASEVFCCPPDARTIDTAMFRLRRKIETDPSNPVYLQTVRGKGYILYSD